MTMTTIDIQNHFIQPDWAAPANIKAYSTLKQSGIGVRQAALNLEDPVPGNINRILLKRELQLPADPIWVKQIHSAIALKAIPENDEAKADATYSNETNRICAVMTADCLPILLCNRQGTQVAAIHAGWRGLANGIIEETLLKLNSPANDILAWLGPAIGPTKFEVRKDVYQAFTQADPQAASAFHLFEEDHWLADIYALARQRLQKKGITHIYGGNHCTYSEQEKFYSYRRDQGLQGFIVSLIWITN